MIRTSYIAQKYLRKQMGRIRSEGTRYMKSVAPHPTGAASGKGSESTGALKTGIRGYQKGKWEVVIEAPADYAYYADQGRGAINMRAKGKRYPMRFRCKHGIRRAWYVGPMEGWHFEEKTANYLRRTFGG